MKTSGKSPGLLQLFLKVDQNGHIVVAICKVVADLPAVDSKSATSEFQQSISKRFEVSRFVRSRRLISNRLHISQDEDGTVHIDMVSYLEKPSHCQSLQDAGRSPKNSIQLRSPPILVWRDI